MSKIDNDEKEIIKLIYDQHEKIKPWVREKLDKHNNIKVAFRAWYYLILSNMAHHLEYKKKIMELKLYNKYACAIKYFHYQDYNKKLSSFLNIGYKSTRRNYIYGFYNGVHMESLQRIMIDEILKSDWETFYLHSDIIVSDLLMSNDEFVELLIISTSYDTQHPLIKCCLELFDLYTPEQVKAIGKIENWFLDCKYNPKYKYCREKVVMKGYNSIYNDN